VSEYALGAYAWLLSLMFLAWGLSSWLLAWAIRSQLRTAAGQIGLVLLIAAGIGWAMASVFDVGWPRLHVLSAAIGIPSVPIAAMSISLNLGRTRDWNSAKRVLCWTANLTWIGLALLVASVLLTGPPGSRKSLIGWPNRLLILAYSLWVMAVAFEAIRVRQSAVSPDASLS
jgi:hypothetical protein